MSRQIVEYDHIAMPQGGPQHLVKVGGKHGPVVSV